MGPFATDLLQDKVVLITGGATGLGRAMGEKFLQLGAKLAITGRREEVLKQAAEEMTAEGDALVFYKACDVRDPVQIQALVESVEQHYGGIDVLVNNAAGNFISPTERLSPRAVDAVAMGCAGRDDPQGEIKAHPHYAYLLKWRNKLISA